MSFETKNPVRVLIVEDEAHNARMLMDMVQKLKPHWKVEAVLDSVADTVNWLTDHEHPNLLLLDIQLSDGICFTIFKKVGLDERCKVIFTTAYDEYAVRAFKVNSIDYLLKPINENELEEAFLKFENQVRIENRNDSYQQDVGYYERLIKSVLSGQKTYRTRFMISGVSNYYKLETQDIAYIYSENKLTFAVDFSSKEYTLDYNLEKLESELNPNDFFRANRKVIVNIAAVDKVSNESGGKLKLQTKPSASFEIIVSRLKAGDFKVWMGK